MNTAEDVTQWHAQAINNRDLTSYLETMNFPFTYQNYNGVALTVDKASDCGVNAPLPWDIILKTDPHWHHTDVDFLGLCCTNRQEEAVTPEPRFHLTA